jgi:hypothetical protein
VIVLVVIVSVVITGAGPPSQLDRRHSWSAATVVTLRLPPIATRLAIVPYWYTERNLDVQIVRIPANFSNWEWSPGAGPTSAVRVIFSGGLFA